MHCLVISEFDTDTILFNDSYIDLSLSEGSYQLIISPTVGTPWEKKLYVDQNYNFTVPAYDYQSMVLSEDWNNWVTEIDSWHIAGEKLLSQSDIYYANNDSIMGLQKIKSPFYNISGANRVTFKIDHRYDCLLYTSPSPRDGLLSRMPSSA